MSPFGNTFIKLKRRCVFYFYFAREGRIQENYYVCHLVPNFVVNKGLLVLEEELAEMLWNLI